MEKIKIAHFELANNKPLVLIAGLNVLESQELAREVAEVCKNITTELKMNFIFKASFDKANRSSINSFRGPGLKKGIEWLSKIKQDFKLPIITDIHEPNQAEPIAEVCDIIQLPAFLSRQTDLVIAMAKTGKPINIKKAQFLSAQEMINIKTKFAESGNKQVMLCERGTSFGYNNLIVDILGFQIMKDLACPLIFDVTHSLQTPGTKGDAAGGRGSQVFNLAKAGVSQKIAGLFLEIHPNPKQAKCDGPCALPMHKLKEFLINIKQLDKLVKNQNYLTF